MISCTYPLHQYQPQLSLCPQHFCQLRREESIKTQLLGELEITNQNSWKLWEQSPLHPQWLWNTAHFNTWMMYLFAEGGGYTCTQPLCGPNGWLVCGQPAPRSLGENPVWLTCITSHSESLAYCFNVMPPRYNTGLWTMGFSKGLQNRLRALAPVDGAGCSTEPNKGGAQGTLKHNSLGRWFR